MIQETHHIRTFELTGSYESLKRSHEALLWKGRNDRYVKKEFGRRHLFNELGRELSINETRGRKCVRVYYGSHDEILYVKAYDTAGYIDYELDLYPGLDGGDETDESESKEDEGPIEPDVYVDTFEEELFDARTAIANNPPGANEVIAQHSGSEMHFRAVPACRWDVYMKDVAWLYYSLTGVETRFYDCGYKLTEMMDKDIDGIINGVRYMYYDTRGVFQRRVYMCGTPWGSALAYDVEVWEYDFQKNTVTMTETSARKNTVLHRFEYILDAQGRITQQKHYMRLHKATASGSDLDMTEDVKHYTTEHYSYNKKGRLCEIRTIHVGGLPDGGAERTAFEYDGQGRLVKQKDYYYRDKKEHLSYEEIYEYIADTRIRVTTKLYTKEPASDAETKEQE